MDQLSQNLIIKKINELLNSNVKITGTPPQGMDSEVFFVADENKKEFAIKYGTGVSVDVLTYDLLQANDIKVPFPKYFGTFMVNGKQVIILEKYDFPLLETIPANKMARYIPSMLENLKEIHKIKFNIIDHSSWKNYLISKFNSSTPSLNWVKISKRNGLNKKLIIDSVEKILNIINHTDFKSSSYSFLHTDFNQRNIFVDSNSNNIAGIIDWGEATYGDPIYDFARVRMFIWHFNLGNKTVSKYNKLMDFTDQEKKLEELYWTSRVIEYLAYYSEELNEFNIGRIKMHQDFLTNYNWTSITI